MYVTQSFIHDADAITEKLGAVLHTKKLTNQGPQTISLADELMDYLQIPNILLFCNGTIALMLALRALKLTGEVITTPFTFPATIHALEWLGLTPVFCDIDNETMCIDADKIEALITPQTSAILGVHVYGMPCDVDKIQAIADKHRLKTVYDAAHCFITTLHGKSIAHYGDAVMFSFHATKLFHTIEGGALICRDNSLLEELKLLSNFGIKTENVILLSGINAKMNELQAVVGRENLKHLHIEIAKRKNIFALYHQILADIAGIKLLTFPEHTTPSLQYYPIRIDTNITKSSRDDIYDALRAKNIFSRKYFYPLCSDIACYRHLPSADKAQLPTASLIAEQILCLPFYGDLSQAEVKNICAIIQGNIV